MRADLDGYGIGAGGCLVVAPAGPPYRTLSGSHGESYMESYTAELPESLMFIGQYMTYRTFPGMPLCARPRRTPAPARVDVGRGRACSCACACICAYVRARLTRARPRARSIRTCARTITGVEVRISHISPIESYKGFAFREVSDIGLSVDSEGSPIFQTESYMVGLLNIRRRGTEGKP